jgi:FKBP-type peptidyl-prolyl cis-trans isomerase FkpA
MQRVLWSVVAVTAAVAVAGCQKEKGGAAPAAGAPTTEEQKALYALGLSMGRQVAVFGLTPEELEFVKAGLEAQVKGTEPAVDVKVYVPKLQELARARAEARTAKEKEKSKAFLDKASKEAGASATSSGVIITTLKEGSGASPVASDTVKVHYRGTLTDGKEFDSSYSRNTPAQFPLGGVIPCWREGLQNMKVGGKSRIVCPPELAYGDRGSGGTIPGGAALTFEVELLEIAAAPAIPQAAQQTSPHAGSPHQMQVKPAPAEKPRAAQ